mgnify:CR=1 FL=1
MLPRTNRLPAPHISRVMKYGKRVVGNGVTLIYRIKNKELRIKEREEKRFVFIVSTKVDKRATVRNRMRRLMSESVRHVLPGMTINVDGVMIGSRGLIDCTQAEVEIIVQDLFQRAKLLKA